MRKLLLLIALISIATHSSAISDTTSTVLPEDSSATRSFPKIGLVLSGGGARGLAHISVLRALDSVGLHIDALTGTSIGAVMTSLYSAGYSGHEIDSIAALVNWDQVLTDKVPLRKLGMEEKELNKKYVIDLPIKNGKVGIERSIMEGQGIWDKFTEFLFPVMGINDFAELKIPFKCVAASIKDGHEVVLGKGSILNSVRASMAVPAAFSPVLIDGELLIDGGVTRNLPVQEVIDMGAEYVIGVDLNHGGQGRVNYDDPTEVLLNIGFFGSDADLIGQTALCDYFYSFNLKDYGAGDFDKVKEITEVGYQALDSLVRAFGSIKSELEAKYGPQKPLKEWHGSKKFYLVDSVSVIGVDKATAEDIKEALDIKLGSNYGHDELKYLVDRVFSTNRYKSLYYNVYEHGEDTYTLEFDAVRKAKAYLSAGLQYNEFERINVIGKLYMHDVLVPKSKTTVGAALGQNTRLSLEHIQSLDKKNRFGLQPFFYLEHITLTNRNKEFQVNAQYRQLYNRFGLNALNLQNRKWQLSAGWRFENVSIQPSIYTDFIVEGKNQLQSINLNYDLNTLDRKRMPTAGSLLTLNGRMIYKQNPNFKIADRQGNPLNSDTLGLKFGSYFRFGADFEHYFKLARKWTLLTEIHSQNNISYTQNLVENIQLGGLQKTFRNQETFIGLDAADVTTNSYSGVGIDFQYDVLPGLYLHTMMDVGTYGYLNSENQFDFSKSLLGFGEELQYNTLAGPLHFAVTYSTLTQKIGYTVYFGFLF